VQEVIPRIEAESDWLENGFCMEIVDHMHLANIGLFPKSRVSKFGFVNFNCVSLYIDVSDRIFPCVV
jgi:hypothetical protein